MRADEEHNIISYAFNASREAFSVMRAPREAQQQAVNCCKGALLGLEKLNQGKPAATEIKRIKSILAANEAGRMSDKKAALALKEICQRHGLPTFEHDAVLQEIEMVKAMNGRGRNDLAAGVKPPKIPIFSILTPKKRVGRSRPSGGIKPVGIKPIDPLALIFGKPRKIRQRGRF